MTKHLLKPNVSIFYLDDETAIIRSTDGVTIKIKQPNVRAFLESFFKDLRERGSEGIKGNRDAEKLFDVLFKHGVIIGADVLGEYDVETQPDTRFFLTHTTFGAAAYKVIEGASIGIVNLGLIGSTLLKMLVDSNFKKFYLVDVGNVTRDDLLSPVYSEEDVGIGRLDAIKEKFKSKAEITNVKDFSSYLNYIDGIVDVTVVTSDTSDYIFLQELNSKLAPSAAAPIIYTWFEGAKLFIGPVHVDGRSACFEDFIRSYLINSTRYYDSKKAFRETRSYQCAKPAITRAGLNFTVGMLSGLVMNIILGIIPVDHLVNRVFIVDPITLSIKDIPIWHDPLCEVCIRHYKRYI